MVSATGDPHIRVLGSVFWGQAPLEEAIPRVTSASLPAATMAVAGEAGACPCSLGV